MLKQATTAAVAAMILTAGVALAAEPVCGDVNNSSSITTSDALLVLRKSVAQPVTLDCSAYDDWVATCEMSLIETNAELASCQSAPVCGNSELEDGEDCEVGDLDGETCEQQGFAGGTLACAPGCAFDTSGCYEARFDASGATILDHETGLEWEKKTTEVASGENYDDPRDVDNTYQWCAGTYPDCTNDGYPFDGSAATDFLAKLNGGLGPDTCYAGYCDWRLPTVEELQALPSPVDAAFQPDAASVHWTATTLASSPALAWYVVTSDGTAAASHKTGGGGFLRAVRAGS